MTRRSFFIQVAKGAAGVVIATRIPDFLVSTRESKIELIKRLLRNAIAYHDDLIEAAIFKQGKDHASIF